jgi:hypothetical protein
VLRAYGTQPAIRSGDGLADAHLLFTRWTLARDDVRPMYVDRYTISNDRYNFLGLFLRETPTNFLFLPLAHATACRGKQPRCRAAAETRARRLVARSRAKRTAARSLDAPLCDLPDATGIARNRIDPVARFHLGNGARLERINWFGNTELRAIQESFGIMVNYLYDHDSIEDNHEAFVRDGTIVRSPDVDALMPGPD